MIDIRRHGHQLFHAALPGTTPDNDRWIERKIRVVERPDHGLTVRDVFRIYTRDRGEVEEIAAHPRISEAWRRWACDFLEKSGRGAAAAKPGCRDAD